MYFSLESSSTSWPMILPANSLFNFDNTRERVGVSGCQKKMLHKMPQKDKTQNAPTFKWENREEKIITLLIKGKKTGQLMWKCYSSVQRIKETYFRYDWYDRMMNKLTGKLTEEMKTELEFNSPYPSLVPKRKLQSTIKESWTGLWEKFLASILPH